MSGQLRWLVAVDGTKRSAGALRWARWLKAQGRGQWDVRPIHVLAHNESARSDVLKQVQERVAASIRDAGAEDLGKPMYVDGFDEIEGLREPARRAGTIGLIVGRAAASDSMSLIRLGPVARRLLRECDVPLVVVPPDYEPTDSGELLVATDLGDHGLAAARFAQKLGKWLDRKLVLCHVAPAVAAPALSLNFHRVLEQEQNAALEGAIAAAEDWAKAHEIEAAECVSGVGPVTMRLLQHGRERNIGLIVCGTRHLGLGRRLVEESTSTEAAAASVWPVVVVPWRAEPGRHEK